MHVIEWNVYDITFVYNICVNGRVSLSLIYPINQQFHLIFAFFIYVFSHIVFKKSMLRHNWVNCVSFVFIKHEFRTWPIPKNKAACISGRKFGLRGTSDCMREMSWLESICFYTACRYLTRVTCLGKLTLYGTIPVVNALCGEHISCCQIL